MKMNKRESSSSKTFFVSYRYQDNGLEGTGNCVWHSNSMGSYIINKMEESIKKYNGFQEILITNITKLGL